MPVSSYSCIPHILESIELGPHLRILDLGIGNGMYGALCRNYWPSSWIEGVEGFDKYKGPMWDCYDVVHCDLIEKYEPGTMFDIIILADVLEHFQKDHGRKLIQRLSKALTIEGRLVVSTPGIWVPQAAVNGNELEVHKSLWDLQDFAALGFKTIKKGEDLFKHNMIVSIFKQEETQ